MPRALVVEHGTNRGALAGVRSLARAGWTVGVATSQAPSLSGYSRAVSMTHRVPPAADPEAFIASISALTGEHGYEVVFPVDDAQVLALSEHRERIRATVPYPAHATVERVLDRLELARLVTDAGLCAPATEPADLMSATRDLDGPLVLKSRGYVAVESGRVETRIGAASELRSAVAEIEHAGGEAILQELVHGRLIAVSVLAGRGGRLVAIHQQTSDRTWPADAGVSARARSTAVDPGLEAGIERLLAQIEWFGLAELQFLVEDGEPPKLIDFNPRFYGSLALAIAAGVDFPRLWAELARGAPVAARQRSRPGKRLHWLGGDLRWVARHPRRVRNAAGALAWTVGATHPIFAPNDPRPAVEAARAFLRRD